jgi:hypothetical protein
MTEGAKEGAIILATDGLGRIATKAAGPLATNVGRLWDKVVKFFRGESKAAGAADVATKVATTFKNLAPKDEIVAASVFPVEKIVKASYSGRLNYVVSESGTLVVGKTGHISLSRGGDVLAAGEVKFVNGEIRSINNASGHYRPSGESAQNAAQAAFQNAGFSSFGKYSEVKF